MVSFFLVETNTLHQNVLPYIQCYRKLLLFFELGELKVADLLRWFRYRPFPERFKYINPIDRDFDHLNVVSREINRMFFDL